VYIWGVSYENEKFSDPFGDFWAEWDNFGPIPHYFITMANEK
jgi:hypothetical protein